MTQGPKGGPRNNGECHSEDEDLQMSVIESRNENTGDFSPLQRLARLANRPIRLLLFGFLV